MTGPSEKFIPLLLVALVLLHGVSAQTLREDEKNLFAFLNNVLPRYPSPFNSSVPTCSWKGISCIGLGAQRRIFRLMLGGLGLNGSIPNNTLGALTALSVLDLSNNFLTGDIPSDIFKLPSLIHLGLSNNRLTGVVPIGVRDLYQLMKLDLSRNRLSGPLPGSLGDLRSLKVLDMHGNNFSGPMPKFVNTKFLKFLDLSSNRISGGVPYEMFFNRELVWLNLSRNLLAGEIAREFSWLWGIQVVDLSENDFEGAIPDFPGQLRQFHASSNRLNGSVPFNMATISYLRDFSVANNKLTGPLPPFPWGLGSDKIRLLDCRNNSLNGSIPEGLLASTNLTIVRLSSNKFTGSIPGNVTGELQELDLRSNNFTGNIPVTLTRLRSLKKLDVSSNHLDGSIPWGLAEIKSLQHLSLAQNRFEGAILPDFSLLVNLMYLNLSSLNISGSIPDSVGELRSLAEMDLSHNHVTGSIPTNLSRTTNLTSLDLSFNNLTGQIPPELLSLTYLSSLDLSFNNLSGEVPYANQWSTFSNSSFEGNPLLCGIVLNRICPKLLSPAPTPSPLPSPSPSPAPVPVIKPPIDRRSSNGLTAAAIAGIVIGVAAALLLCGSLGTFVLFHKHKFKQVPANDPSSYVTNPVMFESDPCGWAAQVPQPASIPVIMFEKPLLNLTFADLLQATNKFHKDSQIADGRYGPTFKGVLLGGFQIVVKVLYDGGPGNELEKAAQLEALGKIRHENLVPLIGYCIVNGERLLVYEFMENGNVHQRLHDSAEDTHYPPLSKETWEDAHDKFIVSEDLSWPIRHRIAIGVARALAFLHHGCSPDVIHRDVTSSNVMLDSQHEPRLADCGLPSLVEAGQHYQSSLVGSTLGYAPPEYAQTWNATPRGDVYSFGVVLLELVTGKRPTGQYVHDSFGGNLVGWVRSLIRDKRGYKCLDPRLLATGVESEMLETLRIGYLCTAELPTKRPTMQQVVGLLKDIHVDVTYV